jgi:sarcosine oxidase subunit gamma
MADIARIGPLALAAPASEPCAAAELRVLPDAAKFIFRGRRAAIEAAGPAFGLALPDTACRAASTDERAALWLGPDEFLLIAPEQDEGGIARDFPAALADMPHALVAVGHRSAGFTISGPEAATVLNSGCPLDFAPEAFPVGMCTRTVLGKAEIVLWRIAPDCFRVEVWRSFASYVWLFLDEARREFR